MSYSHTAFGLKAQVPQQASAPVASSGPIRSTASEVKQAGPATTSAIRSDYAGEPRQSTPTVSASLAYRAPAMQRRVDLTSRTSSPAPRRVTAPSSSIRSVSGGLVRRQAPTTAAKSVSSGLVRRQSPSTAASSVGRGFFSRPPESPSEFRRRVRSRLLDGLGQIKPIPGVLTPSTLPPSGKLFDLQPLISAGLPPAPYIEYGSYETGTPHIMRYGRDPYRGLGENNAPQQRSAAPLLGFLIGGAAGYLLHGVPFFGRMTMAAMGALLGLGVAIRRRPVRDHAFNEPDGTGALPNFSPTTLFAQSVDPYAWRMGPPGAIYQPYGWGPDLNIGMPFNYTHHIDYVREPIGPHDHLT